MNGVLGVTVRVGVGDGGGGNGMGYLKLSSRLYPPLRGSGDMKGERGWGGVLGNYHTHACTAQNLHKTKLASNSSMNRGGAH